MNFHCIDVRDDKADNKLLDLISAKAKMSKIFNYLTSKDKQIFSNLNKRVFKKRPDAKVMIYIGNAHTLKAKTKDVQYKMLRQFIDETGKKVNSINLQYHKEINEFIDTTSVKKQIGFPTTGSPIANLAYTKSNTSLIEEPCDYYKHIDGMILV